MRSLKIIIPAVLVAVAVGTSAWGATGGGSNQAIDTSNLTPEKAQALAVEQQRQQRLQADADDPGKKAAIIASKKADAGRAAAAAPLAQAPQKWPEGIFADSEAPAPGSVFLGSNRWVGTVAGRSVAVYAGHAGDNPATGRLMVVTAASDMSVDSSHFVDLPGSGALHIMSANGTTLTIVDDQGGRHSFDASTSSWA